MALEVGDKALVMPGFGENYLIPLEDVNIGDSVQLYPIGNDTKIAVPVLNFGIGNYTFISPEFNFAGFNWNIDFNFNLIPLRLLLVLATEAHNFKIWNDTMGWIYGDDPPGMPGCTIKEDGGWGSGGSDADYAFLFEDGGGAYPDVYIDVRVGKGMLELWAGLYGTPSYYNKIYYKDTLLTEGDYLTMPDVHITLPR